jgi:hypothetical protein
VESSDGARVMASGCDNSGKRPLFRTRHAAAVAAFVLLAVVGFFVVHLAAYRAGTRNDYPSMFTPTCTFILVLGLGVAAFTLHGLADILFRWSRNLSGLAVKLALAAIPLLTCVGIMFVSKHMPPSYLKGFRRWAIANADIEAIQRWLATDGPRYAYDGLLTENNFPSEWPQSLTKFKPSSVVFGSTDANELTVRFSWAVLDESWGLVVGPPGMTMPEAGRRRTSEPEWEYRLPVKAGAYVYDYMHE